MPTEKYPVVRLFGSGEKVDRIAKLLVERLGKNLNFVRFSYTTFYGNEAELSIFLKPGGDVESYANYGANNQIDRFIARLKDPIFAARYFEQK
jgi:hypothetical protein